LPGAAAEIFGTQSISVAHAILIIVGWTSLGLLLTWWGLNRRDACPELSPQFLVPTPTMPVTTQIGLVVGHYDHVISPRWDRVVASGADIFLGRRVGLDRGDRYPEKIAHATNPIAAPIARTTMMMSTIDVSCSRNGLKPTVRR
jgi:hypothetical protein